MSVMQPNIALLTLHGDLLMPPCPMARSCPHPLPHPHLQLLGHEGKPHDGVVGSRNVVPNPNPNPNLRDAV